jgi:hypothetical protein
MTTVWIIKAGGDGPEPNEWEVSAAPSYERAMLEIERLRLAYKDSDDGVEYYVEELPLLDDSE